jgi:ABC-type methionine transport system permease subunit
MWLADLINILQDHMAMLVKETGNTLYMTFVSTLFAYILAPAFCYVYMLICFDYITKNILIQMIFGLISREYVSISTKN